MKKKEYILIAEDDPDDREILGIVFNEKIPDLPLKFVENGLELIQHLDNVKLNNDHKYPDFILLDLNMPKMDGRQALQYLKKHDSFKKIPVIIFSTTKNEIEISRCYEFGANSYVVKPSSYNDMQQTIDTINAYWLKTAEIPDKGSI